VWFLQASGYKMKHANWLYRRFQMQQKETWRHALRVGGWTVIFILVGILIDSVITIGLNNWDWGLFPQIYKSLWPIFLIIIGFVFVYLVIFTKYTIQTLSIGAISIALLLIIAADKDSTIGASIKSYIDLHFDVNYLAAGFTIVAFLLSVVAIIRTRKKDEEKKTEPTIIPKKESKHRNSPKPAMTKKTTKPKKPTK
jgi:membrane-bound ClpP family serine protease